MSEYEQDCYLAEWIIEGFEAGSGRSAYGWALSAVQKVNPRASFKTAWKVFDAWTVQAPPHQAPAAPPELITSMVVAALLLNRPQISLLVLLCYSGLLRVREGLNLVHTDVFVLPDSVVLCLGQTKRGMEQKVVLRHPAVVRWVREYLQHFPPVTSHSKFFDVSYNSILRWVKKLAGLLGAGHLQLTTHSLRRSGASELSRQGIPLADILLFGRWLRERSAREYIRQGEVAVLRARALLQPVHVMRLQRWNELASHAWMLYDALHTGSQYLPSLSRMRQSNFDQIESLIFDLVR